MLLLLLHMIMVIQLLVDIHSESGFEYFVMHDGDTDKHDEQHYYVGEERMQDGV